MSRSQWQDELGPVLPQLQIIVGALVAGCVFFLVVALLVSRGMAAGGDPPLVSYIAIGSAVMAVLARVALPRTIVAAGRRKILGEAGHDAARGDRLDRSAAAARLLQLLPTATIVACALLEGATFFLLVAYLIEQWLPALVTAVAMIFLLVLHIPTRSRVIHWIDDQLAVLEQERQLGR
jgi:hypothetical protein